VTNQTPPPVEEEAPNTQKLGKKQKYGRESQGGWKSRTILLAKAAEICWTGLESVCGVEEMVGE
jgi:hypothetical protein